MIAGPYDYKINIWSFGSSIFELLTKQNLNSLVIDKAHSYTADFTQLLQNCYDQFSKCKSFNDDNSSINSDYNMIKINKRLKWLDKKYFDIKGQLGFYKSRCDVTIRLNQKMQIYQ